MKRFYVAHVRGAEFATLRKRGFVTFFPAMDDYVFLESNPTNDKLLRKQTELCIAFVKKNDQHVTVSEVELQRMQTSTVDRLAPEVAIKIVGGYCENLEGTITEIDNNRVRCLLKGFKRVYDVWVDRLDVVPQIAC